MLRLPASILFVFHAKAAFLFGGRRGEQPEKEDACNRDEHYLDLQHLFDFILHLVCNRLLSVLAGANRRGGGVALKEPSWCRPEHSA